MDQNYFTLTQRTARLGRLEHFSDRLTYAMSGTAAIVALGSLGVAMVTHNQAATEILYTIGLAATVPAFIGLVAAGYYAKAHDTSIEQFEDYVDDKFSVITAEASLGDLAGRWPIEADPPTDWG